MNFNKLIVELRTQYSSEIKIKKGTDNTRNLIGVHLAVEGLDISNIESEIERAIDNLFSAVYLYDTEVHEKAVV
jgi:hypothetical protein